MKSKKRKAKKCSHIGFYTMHNHVYCNLCHEHLGYFDHGKLGGFVKKIKDTIEDDHLNKRLVKVDVS